MADDPRTEGRDPQLASRLAVEPLDDVTRRRLVSNALRASEAPAKRPSRAWRWTAAAAAVVLVGGITLAVVTSGGGNDNQQASTPARTPKAANSPAPLAQSLAAAPDVGDFGDLDQAANRANLRVALNATPANAASDASRAESAAGAPAASASTPTGAPTPAQACGGLLAGGTVVAQATGMLDDRPTVVFLVQHPDGSRDVVALLGDPCQIRALP